MKRNLSCGRSLLSGFSLNVFSDEECERIHLATLELLEPQGSFAKVIAPLKYMRPVAVV